jgi:DNA repair exonuclease SbcCD ATPase subunit
MEYLPDVREDTIESNDPQMIERLTCTRDIIKEDRERFNKLCRNVGFDFKKLSKEYEERQETIRQLREELASVMVDIRTAERRHWHVKKKRLEARAEQLKQLIEGI